MATGNSQEMSELRLGASFSETMATGPPLDEAMARAHSPANSQDSCHTDTAEAKGELTVVVQPSLPPHLQRSDSLTDSAMQSYAMARRPRGLALIIEIEKYVNEVLEDRLGSQFDVRNLEHLFEQLYFKVEVKKDLKQREFQAALKEFSGHPGHAAADMMILVVLSHGKEGHVYTSDSVIVHVEKIYERFNNHNCPLLKGKPKFFIIQACRGDNADIGMAMGEADEAEEAAPRKRRAPSGGARDRDTTPFTPMAGEISRARPTWEDMIIAYSTIPGYASMRDQDKGTWFIQSMVEVFMNHCKDRELIDLLRMTSERLSQFTNEFSEKQTCNIEMRHLYKRIYFNPGLYHKTKASPKMLRRSQSTPPSSPRRRPADEGDDEWEN